MKGRVYSVAGGLRLKLNELWRLVEIMNPVRYYLQYMVTIIQRGGFIMKKTLLAFCSIIITTSFSTVVLAASHVTPSPVKFAKQVVFSEDEPAPTPPTEPPPEPAPPPEPK
jgi:hypothetical protein